MGIYHATKLKNTWTKSKNGGLIASSNQWIYGQQFLGPLTANRRRCATATARNVTHMESHGKAAKKATGSMRVPRNLSSCDHENHFKANHRTASNPEFVDERNLWLKPLCILMLLMSCVLMDNICKLNLQCAEIMVDFEFQMMERLTRNFVNAKSRTEVLPFGDLAI